MHITINRSEILSVLKRVSSAIVAGDLSYKSSVFMQTGDGHQLTVGATDGILDVVCDSQAQIKTAGRIVLPHRRLTSIMNELPPGMVELSVDSKFRVTVKSLESKRKFTMTGLDPADFPALLRDADGDVLYAMEAKVLQEAAADVSFCIDKGYIDGVLLSPLNKDRFHLLSLSSKASAIATGVFTDCRALNQEVVLPRLLLDAVSELVPDAVLSLSSNDKKITARSESTIVSCARIQQSFPSDWKHALLGALPEKKLFTVSSEGFIGSVKAVSVAADVVEGDTRFIQIDVRYDKGTCIVHTRKSEKSFGEDELPVTDGSDTSCVIHMDGQLLSQALRSFSPVDTDVYYDAVHGMDSLILKNETLLIILRPIIVIEPKG